MGDISQMFRKNWLLEKFRKNARIRIIWLEKDTYSVTMRDFDSSQLLYAVAHLRLVHLQQQRFCFNEIKRIEDKGSLALSSKFANLWPLIFLVPHRGIRIGPSQVPLISILRLGGRIHHADHLSDAAFYDTIRKALS